MNELQISISAIYIGVNLVIATVLGVLVTKSRAKYRVDILDGGNDDVIKAMRAHGNNAEYTPFALLGLAILEVLGAHPYFLHGLGITLTLSRLFTPKAYINP